jgi:DNA-binding MarR family transcriptional regulator
MKEDIGVASGLVRLSFLVQSVYSEVCETFDLTPQQAQLLCVLVESPKSSINIGQIMHLEKSSVSGLVDRVEKKGLVRRVASKDDGRSITVELTRPGIKIADAFHSATTKRLNETVSCMPKDVRSTFAAIAGRIVEEHGVPEVFGDPDE